MPHELFQYTGDGTLALFNTHTGDFETIKYKESPGKYRTNGLNELNHILRCRMTGEEIEISLKLIELVDNIQDHFGGAKIELISGYRSPTLNYTLRSEGNKVALNSLHMQGMAMDIRISGISISAIRDYARSIRVGGVGYYPGQFVHVDVGPVRFW